MLIYHATLESTSKFIFKDKRLKSTGIERFFNNEVATTEGYVYLGTADKALYYANCMAVQKDEENLMIFEFDIPNDLLEVDLDEINYTVKPYGDYFVGKFKDINNPTIEECWEFCKTLRFKDDLNLAEYCTRYALVKSNVYPGNKNLMDIIACRNKELSQSQSKVSNEIENFSWLIYK